MIKIAHRGASGYEFENSMAAYKKAIEMGISIIELDLQRTADGKFVVFHDQKLDRCTNARGRINSFTLDELREQVRLKNGEPIPELPEVCSLFKESNVTALMELKNDNSAEDLWKEVNGLIPLKNVIFGSFYHKQLIELKKHRPQIYICLIFREFSKELFNSLSSSQATYAAAKFGSVTLEQVQEMQKAGLKCLVWTVNESADITLAKKLNFDGIISNYPDRI
jgi:glycerophosphoryl diester phosphodiesterase